MAAKLTFRREYIQINGSVLLPGVKPEQISIWNADYVGGNEETPYMIDFVVIEEVPESDG